MQGDAGDAHLIPSLGDLWKREWQPTAVFLPGESHGQKSLAGSSPEGHKESDTTEATEHAYISTEPVPFKLGRGVLF